MDGGRDDGLIGFPPGLVEQAATDPSELGDLGQRLATAGRGGVVVGSSSSGLVRAARLGRGGGLRGGLGGGGPPRLRGLPVLVKGEAATLALPAGRAVVLNATARADLLRPGARVPAPERYVVAVQAPLRVTTADAPWGGDVGLAPMTFGPPAPHLAFFKP